MRKRSWLLLVLVLLVWSYFARPIYDFGWIAAGRLADIVSNKARAPLLRRDRQAEVDRALEQGDEIDAYLRGQRRAAAQASAPTAQDFSSQEAYARSGDALRQRLRESLRYPPPGLDSTAAGPVKEKQVGEDELATYRELQIPVLPGVHSVGLYLRPKAAGVMDRLPLVIAANGRGGMPAPTADGKLAPMSRSSRELAWDALRRGYAVWMPIFVHYGREGDDLRDRLTVRAWEAGTSLPAIEIGQDGTSAGRAGTARRC